MIRNAIIVAIFLLISITGILTNFGGLFNFIGRPIWRAENNITNTIGNDSYLLRSKASVFAENVELKKENTDLKASMDDYQILKKENDDLKDLLGRLPPKYTFTLANILSRPSTSPYDTIIIDIGNDFGLVGGEQVFGNANVPIGEISKVYAKDSLVTLYSDANQSTEAMIENSNATVTLVGRGGGNFLMTIPNDLPSDPGTMIVLPNAKTEIIAIVDGVISAPTEPLKRVLLHSPVNIQSIKWVEVKRD